MSAGQLPVGLGAADSFAALAGTTVTNTRFSTLNGDLEVSPGSALTGFPPGKVNGTAHTTDSVGRRVNLIGGAQPGNVFWQIGSSATLGTSSTFAGTILALTSISINSGVTLNGRALARNGAVTLINDTINVPTASPPGTTGGGTTPGGTPGGPTGGDTRPPAAPVLVSPRAHARVRAGIVSFSWRPAARAARYTLIVDHHQVNTGPRTRAAMLVRPGSHRYRVIAANRYGVRSSPARAFAAINLPHLHFYWDGVSIHFNKSQSQDIVVGGAAALGVILSHYAPPGLKGLAHRIAAVVFSALGGRHALEHVNQNNCIAVFLSFLGPTHSFAHFYRSRKECG